MEPELMLRFAAVAVAILLLFVNIDLSSFLKRILSVFKFKNIEPSTPIVNEKHTQVDFLKVLGLWYQLKNSCEAYGLKLAAEKLDEVFPLLNNEDKNG